MLDQLLSTSCIALGCKSRLRCDLSESVRGSRRIEQEDVAVGFPRDVPKCLLCPDASAIQWTTAADDSLESKDHLGAEIAQSSGMHAGSHHVVAIRTQRSLPL